VAGAAGTASGASGIDPTSSWRGWSGDLATSARYARPRARSTRVAARSA
jgi:hypothetical protein